MPEEIKCTVEDVQTSVLYLWTLLCDESVCGMMENNQNIVFQGYISVGCEEDQETSFKYDLGQSS